MEAEDAAGSRSQLAASGQQQTRQLLATAYQLLEACDGSGAEAEERRQQLQEQYLALSTALRETLQQCRSLEEAERRLGSSAAAAGPSSGGDDPDAAALRARAADLRARLEEKNSLIKAAIDRLRLLLDALCMWDSSRRELAAAVG
ncbi:hypothetical protein Rsub_07508 [Raphidocelis subcapitata]|uniref:Mediator of RNA polymerase II transcription subunit 30 n=1 Tax=Raphidocelis subcapitata TaxID=307507 RepID=A0A2V0PCW5_9CHLO|nr:hypothetical protein Rsub_07508 [Raphidocelis subcapitata]|eukprot:GBF95007.1 hypothetical protein Rsub_07508 [Raphidocelis subcapitata]